MVNLIFFLCVDFSEFLSWRVIYFEDPGALHRNLSFTNYTNNALHLLGAYYVSITVLSALCKFNDLIFTVIL